MTIPFAFHHHDVEPPRARNN